MGKCALQSLSEEESSVEDRFAKGHPHGFLTIFDGEEKRFMHAVAGGGERPGTSEVAYAMMLGYQGKKYGTKVIRAIVQEWAPQVYKIGHGQYPNANDAIAKAFQCFGEKALDQLDATASPSNPASWKILEKVGFKAAQCELAPEGEIDIDFDGKEFRATASTTWERQILELQAMEVELLKFYNSDPSTPRSVTFASGKRYRMIDPEGNERTVSKHKQWNRMKYHFEHTTFMQ
jgi:GNAT superfamily N-acetyltransferase